MCKAKGREWDCLIALVQITNQVASRWSKCDKNILKIMTGARNDLNAE